MCVFGIYAEMRNCTFHPCFHRLSRSIDLSYIQLHFTTYFKALSFGAQVEYIHFYVLLGSNEETESISFLGFLFPFPLNVWIGLLTSICLILGYALFTSKTVCNFVALCFWLVSVLLEQDIYVQIMTRNRAGIIIATVWMLAAFVLRLLCTGDIYGGLSQGFVPISVPFTFSELLGFEQFTYSRPVQLFSDPVVRDTMLATFDSLSLLNKTHKLEKEMRKQIKSIKTISGQTVHNITSGIPVQYMHMSQKHYFSGLCRTDTRIGMVYSTDENYLKGVLVAIEGRRLVENQGQVPLFSNFVFWSTLDFYTSLINDFEKVLSVIHESGVFQRLARTGREQKQKVVNSQIVTELCKNPLQLRLSRNCLEESQMNNLNLNTVIFAAIRPVMVLWAMSMLVCDVNFGIEMFLL